MRVIANPGPKVTGPSVSGLIKGGPATRFERFKETLKKNAPEHEWKNFRQVAVGLFGEAALASKKLAGEDFRRLALGDRELRFLAEHPGKIREKIKQLEAKDALPVKNKLSASERAGLYAKSARSVLPKETEESGKATFTVATVNDDFTDKKTNLKRVDADVMLVQEAKSTDIGDELSDKFGVHQNTRSDDKAGSAVVWDKREVKGGERGYALGVRPNGAAMLTRWLSYTDVKIDGVNVRMVSAHRPPARFKRLWPAFDANLAKFVKAHNGPIIVGMDANERNPQAMARKTGLKWHAPQGSIDGFLVSPGIDVDRIRRLPKDTSDHHPVVARFTMDKKRFD